LSQQGTAATRLPELSQWDAQRKWAFGRRTAKCITEPPSKAIREYALALAGATAQVTPAPGTRQLNAIAADPAGNPWAVGQAGSQPAIINAPGIGQGGIIVTTGAGNATVTWTGPVSGSGGTDESGRFAVGGLPDGSYTVIASLAGCQPGIATAQVTAGVATSVNAQITCPP
jgi:Carboxypeptidase regulatory-like domain